MRATSAIRVLVRLLAAAPGTVAPPANTSMVSRSETLEAFNTSSEIGHRVTSTDLVVAHENSNVRRVGFVMAVGAVSSILGIFNFIKTTIADRIAQAKEDREPGSSVIFHLANQPPWDAVGENNHGPDDPSGRMPGAYVFNYYGRQVGSETRDDHEGAMGGNVASVHVQHDGPNEYSVISVPKSAKKYGKWDHKICIPWGAFANDKERGGHFHAFIGDIAVACGAQWHWGTTQVTEDDEYRPKCFWIGYEEDGGVTGFQIRPPAFSKSNLEKVAEDPSVLCNGVDFGLRFRQGDDALYTVRRDPAEVIADNKRLLMDNMKRGLAKRSEAHARGLLINDRIQNSAKELCEDPMSMGQDYVNTEEGLFCYMDAKELFPLCHGGIRKGKCFDMKQNHLIKAQDIPRPGMRLGKVPRALHEPYKVITDIRRKKDV